MSYVTQYPSLFGSLADAASRSVQEQTDLERNVENVARDVVDSLDRTLGERQENSLQRKSLEHSSSDQNTECWFLNMMLKLPSADYRFTIQISRVNSGVGIRLRRGDAQMAIPYPLRSMDPAVKKQYTSRLDDFTRDLWREFKGTFDSKNHLYYLRRNELAAFARCAGDS